MNILCHNALLFAYGDGRKRVEARHADAAIGERRAGRLHRLDRRWSPSWSLRQTGLIAGGILLGLLAGLLVFRWMEDRSSPESRAPAVAPTTSTPEPGSRPDSPTPDSPAPDTPTPDISGTRNPGDGATAAGGDSSGRAKLASARPEPLPEAPSTSRPVDPAGGAPSANPRSTLPPPGPPAVQPRAETPALDTASARVVVVDRGSSLYRLIVDEYGVYSPGLLQEVLKANPQITDPHFVVPGLRVVLPPKPGSL
jgi:hypothetical protein